MKKTRYKIITITVIITILILIAAAWYKNSIYPFRFTENFYEENKKHINHIVDYFESFDDIYSAQMNKDGMTEIISSKGLKNIDCTSDTGYKSLLFLREKYIVDKKL